MPSETSTASSPRLLAPLLAVAAIGGLLLFTTASGLLGRSSGDATPVASPVQEGAPPAASQSASEEPDELTLEQHMQRVKRYQRRLGRNLRPKPDGKSDGGKKALSDLQSLQFHIHATKAMVPSLAADMPESERPAFVKAYRRMMVESLGVLVKLELAILDGKQEEQAKLFKEFRMFESKGHKQFK